MKNRTHLLLVLTIALLLTVAVSSQADDKFRVGVILGLSGEGANIGASCKNGITLGLESLKGPVRSKIEVLYEDDQMKPKNAVSAFNKLVNVDKVDVVITFSSSTSKAIAPLAERKELPVIAIASDPAIVRDREWVFNFWVTPEVQAKLLMKQLAKRGYKNIARIVATHDGTLAIKDAFDLANGDQVRIVLDEEYPVDVKDFRPYINKLKAVPKVDAVFVELFFGQTGLFAKQARELGVGLPLFNVETFEDPNELKISDGALVGHWYIQADDPGNSFHEIYRARFPDASIYISGNCHDVIALIGSALSNGKSRKTIPEFLGSIKNYQGAMGVFSATGDNRFSLQATVKIVTSKGFEKLEKDLS